MGTGGPTALKTLTHLRPFPLLSLSLRGQHLKDPVSKDDFYAPTLWAGEPPGTRTPDPLIKSQLLYQLS